MYVCMYVYIPSVYVYTNIQICIYTYFIYMVEFHYLISRWIANPNLFIVYSGRKNVEADCVTGIPAVDAQAEVGVFEHPKEWRVEAFCSLSKIDFFIVPIKWDQKKIPYSATHW